MEVWKCKYCMGLGHNPTGQGLCPICNGLGQIESARRPAMMCSYCMGLGHDPTQGGPCRVCKGLGYIFEREAPETPEEGRIHLVSGQEPYSDRRTVESILEKLQGKVRICETYLGGGTLDLLRSIPGPCRVNVLVGKRTGMTKGRKSLALRRKLLREIKMFITERPRFEFRRNRLASLHDRYIIDGRGMLILGHGLKDIGRKESFVIFLDRSHSGDMIKEISKAFDTKWKQATPMPRT